MKFQDFLTEQQIDELSLKGTLAGGALALAAANPAVNDKPPEMPKPPKTAQAPKDNTKELADNIVKRYKVDPKLATEVVKLAKKHEKDSFPKAKDLLSIIGIESSFNPNAVSGLKTDPAVGLTQIRPGVWGMKPQALKGIEQQISAGSDILAKYNQKLKNPTNAVHAYNVGLTAFLRGDLNPSYVQKFNKERSNYNSM